jgi:hypothetical protein
MASKFWKWLVWPVVFGSAFFSVSYGQELGNSGVGLSGSTRSEFVKSVLDSCLPKQINDPSNKGIPASLLVEYCDCYASDMADRLSNNDLKSVEGLEKEKIVAKFQTAITAAAAVCLDKAKKKLPHSN